MTETSWLDRKEYPLKSRYLKLDIGRMHYIDEGSGSPIVMVHGNPTWSFVYRHLIKGLSNKYRCIAMDHIGFGLSDKPHDWSYLPKDHAKNLSRFLEKLDLKDITLVVQDWGGPIGLSYAVNNPEKIKNLIIINTWMWSVQGDPHYEKFSNFAGAGFGKFMIKYFNFFAKRVMKMVTGDKSKLTKHIHSHYIIPLSKMKERKGTWVFPRQIIHSSDWLDGLWKQSAKLKDKPALLLWGMKDIAFRENEIKKWESLFTNCKVIRFEDAGHFVQEEKGRELCPIIDDFLARTN